MISANAGDFRNAYGFARVEKIRRIFCCLRFDDLNLMLITLLFAYII